MSINYEKYISTYLQEFDAVAQRSGCAIPPQEKASMTEQQIFGKSVAGQVLREPVVGQVIGESLISQLMNEQVVTPELGESVAKRVIDSVKAEEVKGEGGLTNAELTDRLDYIRDITNDASAARYMGAYDTDIILNDLISKVLDAVEGVEPEVESATQEFFTAMLKAPQKELEQIFEGFEFYENNPYKDQAERALAKLRRKKRLL